MLKAGTEEEYWRKNKKWQATDEIYSREIFTGLSIVALGISNKSEKDCYLKEIKKGSSGICGGY
jgi:hypothetical protein